jgi:CRISPR-associated endonuclease Csn1
MGVKMIQDLELAFDVGHSSIGWAVLQAVGRESPRVETPRVNILGCGVVTFGADDCLASKRRDYRRQRRHARSTRHRIAQIEKLLAHLKVLSAEELKQKHQQAGGSVVPWFLAARVLASNGDAKHLLDWTELWDVLRWYAHNRGYDGNRRWSVQEAEAQEQDTEKEKNANALMAQHGTQTMAETFCKVLGLDPLGDKQSSAENFKRLNAAFPRPIVEKEVRRLLELHQNKLPVINDAFLNSLFDDWHAAGVPDLKLPARYQGGLLFGQLVPRFDNRIISTCPITGEKVPGRNCFEFLNYRWAMTLANIGVGFGNEIYSNGEKLRPLNPTERTKVDAAVRRLGFLKLETDKPGKDGLVRKGKNELLEIILAETKCDRHNLDTLLFTDEFKESLKLTPVEGDTTAFRIAWGSFGDPQHDAAGNYHDDLLRYRFTTQLFRGKKEKPRMLTLREIIQQLEKLGKTESVSKIRQAVESEAKGKKREVDPTKIEELLDAKFFGDRLAGRARFSREKLEEAFQQVFHKTKPIHPLQTGGCLEQTPEIKEARKQGLAQQTNSHLVQHRLLILAGNKNVKPKPKEGLVQHLIQEFAAGDKSRIGRITVELARDLQEMSGMTNQDKKKAMGLKLFHHKEVSKNLAEKLRDAEGNVLKGPNGKPFFSNPGLIRKARILDDLENKCPYTKQDIEFVHLVTGHFRNGVSYTVDKDHIVPRSQRLSDALEAQVITFSEVNRMKSQRTALEFIKEFGGKQVNGVPNLYVRSEADFRSYVNSLWPIKDPFKRARAGGAKVSDDEARCWRRKKLLLTEKWEGKEFTPADLAKTRHIVKLAAQQLETVFYDLPKEQQPPVISITGAVTATFRDKSWKLIGELAAVHPAVKEALEKGRLDESEGKIFNPKKTVREITHLHHALDAIALGLITNYLVPTKHQSLDGELSRLIVKGKLTIDKEKGIDELAKLQAICSKLFLKLPLQLDSKNRLHVDDLPDEIKKQIRTELAKKRVVQHLPADMAGLGKRIRQNTTGILRVISPPGETLWKKEQNSDEELDQLRQQIAVANNRNEYRLEITAPVGGEEDSDSPPKAKNPPLNPFHTLLDSCHQKAKANSLHNAVSGKSGIILALPFLTTRRTPRKSLSSSRGIKSGIKFRS